MLSLVSSLHDWFINGERTSERRRNNGDRAFVVTLGALSAITWITALGDNVGAFAGTVASHL